jgi:DNA-binding CsgD family transcriptional regulator
MLTNREREITQLVASGHSNSELSRRLGISEGTVKVHLHHIYEKLGITGRRELKARELLSLAAHIPFQKAVWVELNDESRARGRYMDFGLIFARNCTR